MSPPAASDRVEIRESTPEDAEALREVFAVVASERRYLARVEAPPLEQVRAFVGSLRERGGSQLVALAGSRIVGWCDISRDEREGFRHSGSLGMGLLPAHRGQGHGRALLEATLALAQARGVSRVQLEVFESNHVAIRLYERLCFEHEGRKQRARILDGRSENLVLMARLADAKHRAEPPDSGVRVFFYGSYMNRSVLAEVGLVPRSFEVASLVGFDIRIAPRANLVRAPGQAVFGVLATATHVELERLYAHARNVLGEIYLPEAVLVETRAGVRQPALCYIAPRMAEAAAEPAYLDHILAPARELGFPAEYLARLEAFRP